MLVESGPGLLSSLRELPKHLNLLTLSHGFVGWVFSITGPVLILLSVAEKGGLPSEITISWIFIGLSVGGAASWLLSLYYRQPLTVAITIPGMVLVGTALTHFKFAEVVGAYLVTGGLLILIALSRKIKPVMEWFPLPIAMAMVAGVFLPFGLNIISAWATNPSVSIPTTLVFMVISFFSLWAKTFPPILGAILAGIVMAAATGQTRGELFHFDFARLTWASPVWSLAAVTELSVPLLLTVVAVQNAQGAMVLRIAGYRPPLNAMTWTCGVGTVINSIFCCPPACVTGPVSAIISPSSAGPSEGRYAAGIVVGTLWLISGILAPLVVVMSIVLPANLINLLAGLALFPVLANAFYEGFKGKFRLGALACFMITVSQVTIWNVGAPFWGLLIGLLVSALMERQDFEPSPQSESKDPDVKESG
ncbi:MAG: benzoate/H(+) symporter BenE family transporter [Candidatus Binatia bacterium]|nr:benzoate/H(+) symporter BenE family transporter [Candidatus Binatia bacterium]